MSYIGLIWLALASDMAIAIAYFAIPVTMAVVAKGLLRLGQRLRPAKEIGQT
jgi:hypothetical protein